jgi:anthranilate synthase component 1
MSESGNLRIERKSYRVSSIDLPADLETPVSAFLKLRKIGATFLLESAESVDRLGRYSFLGFASERSLTAHGKTTVYRDSSGDHVTDGEPLDVLKTVLAATGIEGPAPSLLGAAVGYVGYDYARFIEELPARHARDKAMPVCQFSFVESQHDCLLPRSGRRRRARGFPRCCSESS